MKGFEELTKAYIYLAIILIILSFSVSPLYQSIQVATKNTARLTALEIAGVVNMLKSSPSENLKYSLEVPAKCEIDITNGFVKVKLEGGTYVVDFIQTPVTVSENHIDCIRRKIIIEKNNQNIAVE